MAAAAGLVCAVCLQRPPAPPLAPAPRLGAGAPGSIVVETMMTARTIVMTVMTARTIAMMSVLAQA